ncbi:hypothetical protein CA85_44350 [Allorhodopirellula solitaria]|uniref:Uncharacterized protein n=2 Tax=Allorhodopirellula solitaria TaxID=2527987 RepID=A0A5C5X264_9BACT|nr:hypothetical protein CA85_44350 [Allorhodopirellula solitaria]
MKRAQRLLLMTMCVCLGLTGLSQTDIGFARAQEKSAASPQRLDDGVPPAALLTDRGRALAENLRNLRRTRANLGSKHPTLPVIEKAISETEQQLRAWLPGDPVEENPFESRDAPPTAKPPAAESSAANAGMNDTDLSQLVLRLHVRIEKLENRVRKLEQAQQ